MENDKENRGLDLEKELTCSVSWHPAICPAIRRARMMRHLAALSASLPLLSCPPWVACDFILISYANMLLE